MVNNYPILSIITVVNKQEVFNRMLLSSLKQQISIEYQLLTIDNVNNEFKSLYDAYKVGIEKAKGEWIMFIHPDVSFLSTNSLEKIYGSAIRIRNANEKIKLFGVAGVKQDLNSKIYTTIFEGYNKEKRVDFINDKEYISVQTVDACCFIIKKEDLINYGFWDRLSGYHLLVEELCIRINESGNSVVVIPSEIWHLSKGGSLDYSYYFSAMKVINKHKSLKLFCTTSFKWRVNFILYTRLLIYALRNFIHHKFFIRKK